MKTVKKPSEMPYNVALYLNFRNLADSMPPNMQVIWKKEMAEMYSELTEEEKNWLKENHN